MADISLLNCGDFSAAASSSYLSIRRNAATGGIDFGAPRQGGASDSIIISGVEWRATCFWNSVSRLAIGVSKNRGSWAWTHYNGTLGFPDIAVTDVADAHYTCVLAIDPAGLIHVSYNHHDVALLYRRSTVAIDTFAGVLSAASSMVGTNETSVTYPYFVRGRNEAGFFFLFRDGTAGLGDTFMYSWNGSAWSAATGTGTAGKLIDGKTDDYNAYCGAPQFSSDWDNAGAGYMHLPFGWYDEDLIQTSRVSYVRWNGTTFSKTSGAQTVPIRYANCEIVDDVDEAANLYSWPSIALDSNNLPHMTYQYGATNLAIYHTRHNGSAWTTPVAALTGSGATAFWRPDIVVRQSDNKAYIVYNDRADGFIKTRSSTDYSSWSTATVVATDTGQQWSGHHERFAWDELQEYVAPVPYAATAPFLIDSLVYHVPLNEASGTRLDSHRGATWLDVSTVLSVSDGGITVADFETGTDEELTRDDSSVNSFTGDFTITLHANLESIGANRGLISKMNTVGNQRAWCLFYRHASLAYSLLVSSNGTEQVFCDASTFGTPSTAQWDFIAAQHDAGVGISLAVDNGTANTTAHTTSIHDSSELVGIGRGTSTTTNKMDGLMKRVNIWTKVLDATQLTYVYNGGTGRTLQELGVVLPFIYTHGATSAPSVTAGETAVATIAAWGDLPMSEVLSGTNAASFGITDNADGTWALAFLAPATAGTYEVTLTLTNAAGSDATAFTVTVPASGGGLLRHANLSGGMRELAGGLIG